MTDTLPFIQDQDYEGILATFTKKVDDVVSALDISAATELYYDVFAQDRSSPRKFYGTKSTGECQFLTDGTDGKFVFSPKATDMDESGTFQGEARVDLGGKTLKKQECIIIITRKAPTS